MGCPTECGTEADGGQVWGKRFLNNSSIGNRRCCKYLVFDVATAALLHGTSLFAAAILHRGRRSI